jgi:hypothetical protein
LDHSDQSQLTLLKDLASKERVINEMRSKYTALCNACVSKTGLEAPPYHIVAKQDKENPQYQSGTTVGSMSKSPHHSDTPIATSPPQHNLCADGSTSQSNQLQPVASSIEPAQAIHVENSPGTSLNGPSNTIQYHLSEHQERRRVIAQSRFEDAEWVAVAYEREAEIRRNRKELKEREIARAVEIQTEVGINFGWGYDIPREQRYRVVRVGEQQSIPIPPHSLVGSRIFIKEEEVEPILEHMQNEFCQQDVEGNHSLDSAPQQIQVSASAHEETNADTALQKTGISRSKKSKHGEHDLEDDSKTLTGLTSEELNRPRKKRKISRDPAIDESAFTKDAVNPQNNRSDSPAGNIQAAKVSAARREGRPMRQRVKE